MQEALYCFTAAIMNVTGGALAIESYHDASHQEERVKATLGMAVSTILDKVVS